VDPARLRRLLEDLRRGRVTTREALEKLAYLPFEHTESASVDHHRTIRQPVPEVILCQGKSAAQCVEIARAITERSGRALATRAGAEHAEALLAAFGETARWNETARTVVVDRRNAGRGRRRAAGRRAARTGGGPVLVVSAGTADLSVAEEAAETLEFMGLRVERVYDAGVAGIHRLLAHASALRRAAAVVVVAGMEGALPSVVGGITDRPVIAVPTSSGYGASFGGLAALLAMLNSCAAGVLVVNIDNGFGAGYAAGLIARRWPGENRLFRLRLRSERRHGAGLAGRARRPGRGNRPAPAGAPALRI
jgi:pyridinium-3,5-biscarboxylic acid mononucleotide synthase